RAQRRRAATRRPGRDRAWPRPRLDRRRALPRAGLRRLDAAPAVSPPESPAADAAAAPAGADSLLLQRFPQVRRRLPYMRLGSAPTPVRQLTDLPGGGPEIWVKDESGYGGPWGGNKVRKLEWILPDARRRRRRTILTFGALGTNHGLATAL